MNEITNPFSGGRIVARGVPYEQYATQECKRGDKGFAMSNHALADFADCPSRWIRGYKEKQSKSLAWGSLIDCLVLTPKRFHDAFAIAPGTYPDSKTGEPKEWNMNARFCIAWKKEQGDKRVVDFADVDAAQQAVARLKADEAIAAYLECSDKQVWVETEYRDKTTGLVIPFKCLIDLAPFKDHEQFGNTLGDLKTTQSADPRKWRRFVFENGYHVQAAIYLDAYTAATGENRHSFCHVIQENVFPYEPGRRFVSAEFLDMGRLTYVSALRDYANALSTGIWPGYDDRTNEMQYNGFTITEPEAWMIKV